MMPAGFSPFVEQAPFCVMTRLALESLFRPERLDELFRDTAERQYKKELLFSQVVELMMSVVLRVVIEGACRHVIKDRMERAGMLWTLDGASALLRLRVVHTNGSCPAFDQELTAPPVVFCTP